MPYTPSIGTLGYIVRDGQVLLVHRNARLDDEQRGKWNGLGGKLEPEEDPVSGMKRELREEANIEVTDMVLRGTINWPGFGAAGTGAFGFVFLVTGWIGEIPDHNVEGDLVWHDLDAIGELPMYDGDKFFLPYVFDDDPRQWHMVLPYDNDHVIADRVSIVR
ncbi:MAG: NUDIX hydrolase [Propionibacteriaceae bacterium]